MQCTLGESMIFELPEAECRRNTVALYTGLPEACLQGILRESNDGFLLWRDVPPLIFRFSTLWHFMWGGPPPHAPGQGAAPLHPAKGCEW